MDTADTEGVAEAGAAPTKSSEREVGKGCTLAYVRDLSSLC